MRYAPDGIVDVCNKKCRTEGCVKQPSFEVAGTKTAEYCAQHALDGMAIVFSRKCRTGGCGKIPSFGVAGRKTAECCAQHGMVNVCNRKCRTQGCGKKPLFRVANTTKTEYNAQHARRKCGIEGYRERGVDPQHSGKESIGNVIPSSATAITFGRPPTQASLPSGGGRNSRKRVRHPEITSTASKGAVSRESTGGAVTLPGIDGRKSPVQRNSSVKTKVQLSL